MKVVIIEFIDEFEAFLRFIQQENYKLNDFVIIALEPRLQSYLKNKGINFSNTLPYFNNESHKKIIVETEKIMQFIHSNFKFIDNNGLKDCYEIEFAHYIRIFLNHIFKMLEILENIYRENNNCEIFAHVDNRGAYGGCMITNSERYIGVLAEVFAKKNNLKFTNLNENRLSAGIKKPARKKNRIIERLVVKFIAFFLHKKKVIFVPIGENLFKSIAGIAKRDSKIVFIGIDYSNELLKLIAFNILSFLKTTLGIIRFRYYLLKAHNFYEPAKEELLSLMGAIDAVIYPQEEHMFEYNGINYGKYLSEKVNIGFRTHMLQMVSQSHNLKYLFGRFNKRIIISFYALGIMGIAGELSRRMGIKSLFVSHGAHPVPVDQYHEMELINLCRGFMLSDYTHVALSTPVQEEHLHYFKKKYLWVNNTEVRTGPLIFADISRTDRSSAKRRLGLEPDEIVLTHATTTKARHGERYYFLETFDELFYSLSDIIESVEKLEGVRLIVRIHPGFYLSDEEIRTLLPPSDKYIINRTGLFIDVLAATDILISYSSTTIDEALLNKIPVLLYDRWNRYSHFKTASYDNPKSPDIFPVCYVDKREKLYAALDCMIEKTRETQKDDIDVSKYCYNEDYSENFYKFIEESV